MSPRRTLWLGLGIATLVGCAAAPFEHRPQQEIRDGPGMFSGAAGAFVFRTEKAAPEGSHDR